MFRVPSTGEFSKPDLTDIMLDVQQYLAKAIAIDAKFAAQGKPRHGGEAAIKASVGDAKDAKNANGAGAQHQCACCRLTTLGRAMATPF